MSATAPPTRGGPFYDVELVRAEVVHNLRLRVLRPGQPRSSVDHDYDHWPQTFHVAAFSPASEVIACATFYPEAYGEVETAWRLRAMASAPEVRGHGYGARTLRRGIAEVRVRGGTFLWCNARSGAVWFYERIGFNKVGEEFEIPPIGPHYVMTLDLETFAGD